MTAVVDGRMRPAVRMLDVHGESTPVRALLGELRRSWRLLPMLARQDFSARYRSAGLGVLWSVALPLLQGTVLAVVFTHVVRVNAGGVSYSVLVLTGINAWAYLSSSWTMGSTAIVDGAAIAGRVYFPRALLPAVGPTANLVGYVVGNVVLIGLMAISGVPFSTTLTSGTQQFGDTVMAEQLKEKLLHQGMKPFMPPQERVSGPFEIEWRVHRLSSLCCRTIHFLEPAKDIVHGITELLDEHDVTGQRFIFHDGQT